MDKEIGQLVLEFIINSGLVWVDEDCLKPEYTGGVMVWSANTAEQLTSFIQENNI